MVDLSPANCEPPAPPLVLLVDDDADTCEMFGLFLHHSGFRVEQATNGTEALCKLRSTVPDIVVTDIVLPGMDGIALTGYSSPSRVQEAERVGLDAFLLKPCAPDDLLGHIRRMMQMTRTLAEQSREVREQSEALRRATAEARMESAATRERVSDAPWRDRSR